MIGPMLKCKLLLFTLFSFAIACGAASACTGKYGEAPAISINQHPEFNYTGAAITRNVEFVITTPAGFNGQCLIGLIVEIPYNGQNLFHAQGLGALPYSVGGPFDNQGAWLHQIYMTQSQTASVVMTITIPANYNRAPAGRYKRYLITRLTNLVRGGNFSETTLSIGATVSSSCALSAPSLSSLDFSSAISNGTIPTSSQRTLSFDASGCNGPARLTLTGQPMTRAGSLASIHYSATATLGGTPVTLDTRNTSASSANNISAPDAGQIPMTITVLPSSVPLAAGTYSSILRVGLEPAQ